MRNPFSGLMRDQDQLGAGQYAGLQNMSQGIPQMDKLKYYVVWSNQQGIIGTFDEYKDAEGRAINFAESIVGIVNIYETKAIITSKNKVTISKDDTLTKR